MTCDNCGGSGRTGSENQGECSECNTTGFKCDVCGEACDEPGEDVCHECAKEGGED